MQTIADDRLLSTLLGTTMPGRPADGGGDEPPPDEEGDDAEPADPAGG